MNVTELIEAARNAEVPDSAYEIRGVTDHFLTDGGIYLESVNGRWVVGGFERGVYRPDEEFTTEDEACRHVYDWLIRTSAPQPETGDPVSEEERAEYLRRGQELREKLDRLIAEAHQSENPPSS